MRAGDPPPTPELERQRAANQPRPPFDVLSQFYDWLKGQGLFIAHYGRVKERSVTCSRCKGRRFEPGNLTPREQQLLSRGLLPDENRDPCRLCEGSGVEWLTYVDEDSLEIHPLDGSPERLFADFWGLDLAKISAEREALLDEIRANNTNIRETE